MSTLRFVVAGLLAASPFGAAADDQPAERSEYGLPLLRISAEPAVERSNEWFHENRNRPDLILEYAKRQLRIPLGRHYGPVVQQFSEEVTRTSTYVRSDSDLLIGLASAFALFGDRPNAIKHLLRALELDPRNSAVCFDLAVAYAVSTDGPADRESARIWYDRAIRLGAEKDTNLEQLIK